jgi:hypothetical protein
MEFCCMRWISAFTLEQLRAVRTKRTTLHVIMGETGPKKYTAMPYVISATATIPSVLQTEVSGEQPLKVSTNAY